MTSYLVNELFTTFQGEGVHMGRPAFFVRLHGCDQACPWCDSAGTWHPKFNSQKTRMTAEEIVTECPKHIPIVVITGGEPTLQDLGDLLKAFKERNHAVHLETAGHHHHNFDQMFDWVTVSPKPLGKAPRLSTILRADELKIIVDEPDAVAKNLTFLLEETFGRNRELMVNKLRSIPVWLHPEWSRRDDPRILNVITRLVKDHATFDEGIEFRAGYQVHKLYGADVLDPRADSREIPLGGTGGSSR